MSVVIKVEDVSKQYRLGQVGTGSLNHDLNRWWHSIRGKEDPYLKIGEENNRAKKGVSEYVWSLKDINFEIEKGDAVGIIGRNGAGKSTLLKLLSRVTSPTTGSIKAKGRIASLLEVGTGFHPELTGRENIFLNGAILGMRKKEIERKLDQIVDFSGVERYIDTPVKRYSSGMYVRLAFAVAAHLESEILIVDEVLAVGDAEFQKKCLGKMGEVSKGEGRTILFVSHNLGSIQSLCTKGMVLHYGNLMFNGQIEDALVTYQKLFMETKVEFEPVKTAKFHLNRLEVVKKSDVASFKMDEDIEILVSYELPLQLESIQCVVHLWALNGVHVLSSSDIDIPRDTNIRKKGEYTYVVRIPKGILAPNHYRVTFAVGIPNLELILETSTGPDFEVIDAGSYAATWSKARRDVVIGTLLNWENK
ncbi:ABC transporter ATP-binding protein [Ferruginibacter sp. SUN002]|uniref:ABC transporter ATP-binding protein n=1 Tax=Ferruginibacter sp. SUN002 TaxID=2937789 RepID=UPI003D361D78